jgi:DNA gyrase subunit B
MSQEPVTYDASHITVLEGLEAVRKRPGMYIGSTAERGLHSLVLEATGWGIDEMLTGRATRVDVTLLSDGGLRVADNGPGADMADLATALTVLTAGWSSVGGRYPMRTLLAQPSVVNALSRRLVAEVRSEGRREVREYACGAPAVPDTASHTTSHTTSDTDIEIASGSGTTLTFWPDPDIFETTDFSFEALADRLRELAFLYRRLDFELTDARSEPRSLRLHFPDGVRELVAHLDGEDGSDIASFEQDEPQMAGTMEIAWRWHGSAEEQIRGFANSGPSPEGGTHVLGFRDGVAGALTAFARERGLLAATDPDVGADAIGAGLTAVVSVKLEYPQFEGCTHGALGNVEVRGCVRQAVEEHFGAWLADHPQQAAGILGRAV